MICQCRFISITKDQSGGDCYNGQAYTCMEAEGIWKSFCSFHFAMKLILLLKSQVLEKSKGAPPSGSWVFAKAEVTEKRELQKENAFSL